MEGEYQSQNMNLSNKSKGIMSLVWTFVFLLVICALFYFFINKSSPVNNPQNTTHVIAPVVSQGLPPGYSYKVIAKNQYPTGFPKAVIVQSINGVAPVWQRGEDTKTGDGTELKIVELLYAKTDPMDLAMAYEKSFKSNSWILDISRLNNTPPVVRFFMQGKVSAIVTIIKVNSVDSLANITISTK